MFRVRVICSLLLLLAGNRTIAQESEASPVSENYSVQRLAINTEQNEYAPVLRNGELFFTSDSRERIGVYFSSTDSAGRLSNIFRAKQLSDVAFGKPGLLDNRLNRFYNSGPASLSGNGTTVFFSSNEPAPFLVYTAESKSRLQLYTSELSGSKWSKRTLFPFADPANYTHPCLSGTGDTLWFSSDRAGGFGGYDLYFSVLQQGKWSAPVNPGPAINSAANDVFPALSGDRLVYSSDREGGFGKLDLYAFDLSEKQLTHLDSPFNSEADDFGFCAVDEKKSYFTSNREGSDDIYFCKELFPSFKGCEPYVKDKFCFTFFEETEDLENLDEGLDLEYEWNLGDGTVIKGKEARHCFAGYGEYLVELNIVDKSTNALFFTQSSYPFSIERTERLHIEGPDTIPLSVEVTYLGGNSSLPGYDIENYYWEADNGAFRKSNSDTVAVRFASEGWHELILGVRATSQETGETGEFCVTRSIFAAAGALLKASVPDHVIPESALAEDEEIPQTADGQPAAGQYTLFLGAGDSLVPALRMHDDSVRVENVGDSLFLYSVGSSDNKLDLLNEYREAQEMGFTGSQVTEHADGNLIHKNQLAHSGVVEPEMILDPRIRTEQIMTTFEVFYGLNVFVLTRQNKKQLKKLTDNYLPDNNQRVLISSFTDSKGDDAYNLELSKKRSESVRNELIANGYPADQIEVEYYGNRVPLEMEPFTDAQRRKSLIIVYEKN